MIYNLLNIIKINSFLSFEIVLILCITLIVIFYSLTKYKPFKLLVEAIRKILKKHRKYIT